MTEKEIIEQYQNNPKAGFKLLVEHYQSLVVNTCYSFLHSKEDAEDVAQEVFVEVYEKLDTFRGDSKISTWLYRIASNRSLDLLKYRNRKKRFGIMQSLFQSESEEEKFANEEDNIENEISTEERNNILHEAILQLNDKQQMALNLNRFEELSYAEIADIMNTSVSAVESLLHRAKQNLKKEAVIEIQKNI